MRCFFHFWTMKILVRGVEFEIDEIDIEVFNLKNWKVIEPVKGYQYIEYRTPHAEGHKSILFHREILGVSKGQFVDHIDGNTRNNKRSNLRVCTHAENMRNRKTNKNSRTGVKGVSIRNGRFRAVITAHGVRKHLGCFDSLELAHAAYCTAAMSSHGEFARFQ